MPFIRNARRFGTAALIALAAAPAWAAPPSSGLPVPAGASLLFTAQAEGVQIYTSKAAPGDKGGFAWTLKAPSAALFDSAHNRIGTHSAGPTWAGVDGSKVVGTLPARQTLASPTPGSIPWLLIEAKSHEGVGMFGAATAIMRVDTVGGAAPAQPPTKAGQETRVKYTATYVFLASLDTP